tara:strand:+ start:75 stop:227 length:153 start_codon:yes stop_codon:yes gene_type:complete
MSYIDTCDINFASKKNQQAKLKNQKTALAAAGAGSIMKSTSNLKHQSRRT